MTPLPLVVRERPGASPARSVLARLGALALARLAAQALSIGWFVYAARVMNAEQFGFMGGALALMVVIGGMSDLGTSRSVVRLIDGTVERAWPAFVSCGRHRILAGVGLGVVAVGAFAVLPVSFPAKYVALASLIALASGVAEVGFGALRSLNHARAEMQIVVAERIVFVTAAVIATARGHGALAALVLYALTNLMSAVTVTAMIHRRRGSTRGARPTVLDREGRATALASTLLIVMSRASTVVLVLMVSPATVGRFVVASRIPEAVALLGATALAPLLSTLRAGYGAVSGDGGRAATALTWSTRIVLLAASPLVLVMLFAPSLVLRVLVGGGAAEGAVRPMRVLALWLVLYLVRSRFELIALASDRAGRYAVALSWGLAVNVVITVIGASRHGADAAALGTFSGELVIVAILARQLTAPRRSAGERAGHDADVGAEIRGNVA